MCSPCIRGRGCRGIDVGGTHENRSCARCIDNVEIGVDRLPRLCGNGARRAEETPLLPKQP